MKYVGSIFLIFTIITATDVQAQSAPQNDTTTVASTRFGFKSGVPRRIDPFAPANDMSAIEVELIAITVGAGAGAVFGCVVTRGFQSMGDGRSSDGEGFQRFVGAFFGAALGASVGLLIVSIASDEK